MIDVASQVHQGFLIKQLKNIFPGELLHINSRKQSNLKNPLNENVYLELDVWLPKYNLCFEFQDSHHYVTTWYNHTTLNFINQRDYAKKVLALEKELILIPVPCWWDGSIESLAATIKFNNPSLDIPVFSSPISLNPPENYFKLTALPHVGDLMLASFPDFNMSFAPDSWWMGEKFDGIRCCWNPVLQATYTRSGRELSLIPIIEAQLPKAFLDCEFWFGRGNFSMTASLTNESDNVVWDHFRVIPFDAPSQELQALPFEIRYSVLLDSINLHHPFCIIAARVKSKGSAHVSRAVQEIIDHEGEGLVLRKVASPYLPGRNSLLFKLKKSHGDLEGIVIAMGSSEITLKLPQGDLMPVPVTRVLAPIQVGDIVTFSYENFVRGRLPVNPTILRVRSDLSWKEVVINYFQESKHLSEKSQMREFATTVSDTGKNLRKFFEEVARKKNLDPLLAETWYNISPGEVFQMPGRPEYKGYHRTLEKVFPDVKFDPQFFCHKMENRRKFFENYATEHGFDPLIPSNWYLQPRERIMAKKGVRRVLHYHDDSIGKALIDLFPDIGLDRNAKWESSWNQVAYRVRFFQNYAQTHNFDPLVPDNWYQHKDKIMSTKGIQGVIFHHKNSLPQALVDLFPNIGLQKSRLKINQATFRESPWMTLSARRKFFENYAIAKGFDPLDPENWYSQSKESIMSFTEAFQVIHYHNNNVVTALTELFPDIGLTKAKFLAKSIWSSKQTRVEFFERYAAYNGFDPLIAHNWYKVRRESFVAVKGARSVLAFYNDSLTQALADIFPGVNLDPSKFRAASMWSESRRRRQFFEEYAKENGFDPLDSQAWYHQSKEKILAKKGANRVLFYHNYNLAKALVELFPKVRFDVSKLTFKTSWQNPDTRRQFFITYAEERGFDPLVPRNWYLHRLTDILSAKGARNVVAFHNYEVATALIELFPEIGLDKERFNNRSSWSVVRNRRKFFEDYALWQGFDPKHTESWYSQQREMIMSFTGAHKVMKYHNSSVSRALIELFPNLDFKQERFSWSKNMWSEEANRRRFFEDYALENGFDPLQADNWYTITLRSISKIRGGLRVIGYHNNSVITALTELFPEVAFEKLRFVN